ncbi:hypothetical protein M6B38_361565 [Iris pallida]|uniref:Uncharacterized protein n=1 Tax=Iris pallida TaxID=29817 RepID=A0AAX6GK00_IRIPA|nr:hypothetical protein M6B38_361565 [Iris pallida]
MARALKSGDGKINDGGARPSPVAWWVPPARRGTWRRGGDGGMDDLVDQNLVNSGEIHDGGRGGTRWRLAEGWPRLNSGDGICVSDVDSDVCGKLCCRNLKNVSEQ